MTTGQLNVRGDGLITRSSKVAESSQPGGAVVLDGVMLEPPCGWQLMLVTSVSPDPPSRKLTWMSASGGSTKVKRPPVVGRLSPQLVPVTTVVDWLTVDGRA